MKLAPVILFTYNRPFHTKNTIEALSQNELAILSDLIIFSDAARNADVDADVKAVREYLKTIRGFKSVTIIEREKNYGLAINIIDGVTRIIQQHGRVIVLEDDLLTSPYFLRYMNHTLELYEREHKVLSIHGYVYPVKRSLPSSFFLIDPGSLGWGTWKDRWDNYQPDGARLLAELRNKKLVSEFNYDDNYPFIRMLEDQVNGRNNSWVIRWYAYALLNQKVTLYPGKSLVFHAGNDGSGTHEGVSSCLDVELAHKPLQIAKIDPVVDMLARDAFKKYFRTIRGPLFVRGIRRIKNILQHAGA
jgi:hypothetical protein